MRQSGYAKHPNYRVYWEPSPKRVRVQFNDHTVVDSERAVLLYETKHIPVYYFPMDDVDDTVLRPSQHTTFCPFKGEANYRDVVVNDKVAENAMWHYPAPFSEVAGLDEFVSFYWNRMDAWFEEDEEIFVHPRDPHVRIDIVESRRLVEVRLGSTLIAASDRTLFLFETGLPTRYYFPYEDVRHDVLRATPTQSACPYKGQADYFSAVINDEEHADIAWRYRTPRDEVGRIAGRVAFFTENVDEVSVAGVPQSPITTK
ncbi:MAG: DUF427 domain-containing protein [Pseudomonadota bacterium]